MGMESYYITLNVESLTSGGDITSLFKQEYHVSRYKMPSEKLFKRRIADDRRFVIDHKAVVTVVVNQNTADITFELCFSNYENNLLYIYNVAKWVSLLGKTTHLKVLNSTYNFGDLDYEKFRAIISESFSGKYHHFNQHYGEINTDILPCDFYGWIRRMGLNRKKE